MKSFAAGGFSRLTLMLKAGNESDPNGWKRFDDDAVLDVSYVGLPGVPTSPIVGTSCETDAADPAWLSNPKPKFSGVVQTEAGGESGANLRAHFTVQEKQSDGTWDLVTEPVRPSSGYVGDGVKVTEDSPITLEAEHPLQNGGVHALLLQQRCEQHRGPQHGDDQGLVLLHDRLDPAQGADGHQPGRLALRRLPGRR
ncbi:hypothetical protein ACRAWF_44730 [Streptomyces sp. L7]